MILKESDNQMENIIQVCLPITPLEFDKWLTQDIPETKTNMIVVPQNGIPEFFDPKVSQEYKTSTTFIRILGTPFKADHSIGNNQYQVTICEGDLEDVKNEKGVIEDILFLTTSELPDHKTLVAVNWELNELRPYMKEITDQISSLWPETNRVLHRLSICPFNFTRDNLLVELIINAEPQQLFEWLEKDIGENAGGVCFIDNIDGTQYETQFISSELFPPDFQYNFWEHHLVATTQIYIKNSETNKMLLVWEYPNWVISRIELIPMEGGKNKLILFADYITPETIQWFKYLETRIKLVFCQSVIDLESARSGNTKILEGQPSKKLEQAYIPSRTSSLQRWKATWACVKRMWKSTVNVSKTHSYLKSQNSELYYCEKRLRLILKAGDQGLLD